MAGYEDRICRGRRVPKYSLLADEIASQVTQGVLRPGEQIPSVRQMSRERGVSVTTVLEAYRRLEDRGLIRAQPQSGYFVAWKPSGSGRPRPKMSSALAWPAQVTISDLDANILVESVSQGMVRFGAAVPAVELLPTDKLNRILGSIARRGEVSRDLHASIDGWEELRRQIAQRRSMQGCPLDSDEVVITSGCTESLSLALRVTTKPGDLVAVESPTYFGILQILEVLGLQALEIPTHPQTGMSLEALEFALLHDDVKAVVVMTCFSNPLGSSMPDAAKRRLVTMLGERDIPLIEDDVDGELYFEGSRPTAAKCYDERGLVLLCSSFSKDIAPTYRVGWIAPGKFLKRVKHVRAALSGRAPVIDPGGHRRVSLARRLRASPPPSAARVRGAGESDGPGGRGPVPRGHVGVDAQRWIRALGRDARDGRRDGALPDGSRGRHLRGARASVLGGRAVHQLRSAQRGLLVQEDGAGACAAGRDGAGAVPGLRWPSFWRVGRGRERADVLEDHSS